MTMRKGLTFFVFTSLLAATALFTPTFAHGSTGNDTFVFGIEGDPGNDINTITTSGRYDLTAERLLYSPLYNYHGPQDIDYLLAESIDVAADGTSVTAHLRQNVVWSDGHPFTADDVLFTYGHILTTDYATGRDGLLLDDQPVAIEKIDDHTVLFRAPKPFASLVENLVSDLYIMPKHVYGDDKTLDNNAKNAQPVGTGPYTLAEYKPGQYMKFRANERYFGEAPKIGTVIFQIIGDLNSAALALKKGELNALVIPNSIADDFTGTPVTLHAYPEDRVGYMVFNLGSPRVADVNLRKAVFYALDRHEMNVGAYLSEKYFVDALSFLPYSNPFFTDRLESYGKDVDKARDFLAKVEEVPTLRLAYSANNVQQEVQAMVIQQNLRQIGVNVELMASEGRALYAKMSKGTSDIEMYLNGYIMGVDPSLYACLFISGGSANISRVADKELDELFKSGSAETNLEKRRAIYDRAQARLADLAVFYPIVTNSRILGVSNNVGGVDQARLIPIYTFNDISRLYFKE